MNKKLILLFAGGLICLASMSAQQQAVQTEVISLFLDESSYIVGQLLGESIHELELMIPGGDMLTISKDNVTKLRRTSEGYSFTRNGRFNYNKGFYYSFYPLVFYYGNRRFGRRKGITGIGTQFHLGRHHNERLSYGLIVARIETDNYHHETDFSYWFTALPVAAFVNYNINVKGPRLYMTGKIGHAFKIDRGWFENSNSGMYSTLGFGVALPTRGLSRLTVELEGTFIKSSGITEPDPFWQPEEVDRVPYSTFAKYITFKLGIALRQ